MYSTEGVECIKVLVLVCMSLVKVQGFTLQLIGHEEVVDDVVLHQGVLSVGGGHYGVEGHIVHLGVNVLLLIPGSKHFKFVILILKKCIVENKCQKPSIFSPCSNNRRCRRMAVFYLS